MQIQNPLMVNTNCLNIFQTFQNKIASYFSSKQVDVGTAEELQFGVRKRWQSRRQVWRTKDRNITLYRKRRKVGGAAMNERSIGGEQESGWGQLLTG